jgi:hypothetical protein
MLQPFVIRQRTNGAASCQTGTASDGNDVGYFNYTFAPSNNNGNVTGQSNHFGAGQTRESIHNSQFSGRPARFAAV